MSATRFAPAGSHPISFATHWRIPAEHQYGDWADTLAVYYLQHDNPNATLGELAADIEIGLNPDDGDPHEFINLPDDRATWHRNYTPLEPWIRAHVLRLANGWKSKRLASYLENHASVTRTMGFREAS
ncbi:hypothetical protein [Halorussus salinus]|uniref:hypothetical protein n=1 Tax=Halorussus salinus TaxID=1364935 RepID=UPI0010930454|nr:hypothetical protein [Halorussus salinus]